LPDRSNMAHHDYQKAKHCSRNAVQDVHVASPPIFFRPSEAKRPLETNNILLSERHVLKPDKCLVYTTDHGYSPRTCKTSANRIQQMPTSSCLGQFRPGAGASGRRTDRVGE
jgi:hypothetical protein